jgi:UDP-glucose 4-epimerase
VSPPSGRALVSGGAGFIGSHLVDALLDAGWAVRVVDDFSSGREENLVDADGRFELVRADFTDPGVAAQVVDGIDVVFHQGAVPSVPRSVAEPVRTNRANVDGTLLLLTAARDAGVRRFVYASSSSAYGETPVLPKVETMPADPRSPYALQKYAGEVYCRLFRELYGLETVALRYFNVFGPRQDPHSTYAAVVPRFATACLQHQAATIHGDGEQTRDFVHAEDLARGVLSALDAPEADVAGEVFQIGTSVETTVNQLAEAVERAVGRPLAVERRAGRAGDVRRNVSRIDKARARLRFEPRVALEDGLRVTASWYARALVDPILSTIEPHIQSGSE